MNSEELFMESLVGSSWTLIGAIVVDVGDKHEEIAVVKAIDNPFGSLSTTFEAIQALMKLWTQLSQKMKESSCMWAPPMYRRLLSSDKREKDMCQRCLLSIKPVMLPPSLTLSKVTVRDLKSALLTGLMELLKKGKKLQALQAWGWFIRLVGSLALKNKNFVNEMLKVPEQTSADQDSQVQIASLIAWEGLTDALIYLPSAISDVMNPQICRAQKDRVVSATSSQFNGSEVEKRAFLKSLKLIMTPLTGIMSNKCDIAGPTFPDLLAEKSAVKPQMSKRTLRKHYSIRWLPWDCCYLEFVLRMIDIIITGVMTASVPVESKVLAYATTERTFRSFLKGAQSRFNKCSSDHDTITKFLSMILISAKNICEDATSKNDCDDELVVTCLQLVKSVAEELEPYKIMYLTLIYVTVIVQATSKATSAEPIIQELSAYFKFALSSYDAVEIAQAIVGVLYCNGSNSSCWRVWVATVQGLQEYLDHSSELMPLKVGSAAGNLALIHLLAYPLMFCSSEIVAVMEKIVSSEPKVAECILENLPIEKTTPERSEFDCRQSSGIDNCVLYSASLRRRPKPWSFANSKSEICLDPKRITITETPDPDSTFLRLLPSVTRLVARLQLKEDIVFFFKVIYGPLATWVSDPRMNRCYSSRVPVD
ncbi:hypothetical protein AKJ16_DCAP00275 [Drosera capensis]